MARKGPASDKQNFRARSSLVTGEAFDSPSLIAGRVITRQREAKKEREKEKERGSDAFIKRRSKANDVCRKRAEFTRESMLLRDAWRRPRLALPFEFQILLYPILAGRKTLEWFEGVFEEISSWLLFLEDAIFFSLFFLFLQILDERFVCKFLDCTWILFLLLREWMNNVLMCNR